MKMQAISALQIATAFRTNMLEYSPFSVAYFGDCNHRLKSGIVSSVDPGWGNHDSLIKIASFDQPVKTITHAQNSRMS